MNVGLKEMEKVKDDCATTSNIESKIFRVLLEICTDVKMIKARCFK